MANSKKRRGSSTITPQTSADKPITLKDLLGTEAVAKLKQQAAELKQEEAKLQEKRRIEAEALRQVEQKLKEQDFEYLLNNSNLDWTKHK